jgi:hypothetical protein
MLPHESALPRTIYYLPCSFIFIASNEELCWVIGAIMMGIFSYVSQFPLQTYRTTFIANNKNLFMCEWMDAVKTDFL